MHATRLLTKIADSKSVIFHLTGVFGVNFFTSQTPDFFAVQFIFSTASGNVGDNSLLFAREQRSCGFSRYNVVYRGRIFAVDDDGIRSLCSRQACRFQFCFHSARTAP